MEKASIRILVVDDFEPWRRFISSTLPQQPRLQIVGEAADGVAAIQKAGELQPDLILLDIGLPNLNGIEAARRIRSSSVHSKILFVSEHRSVDMVRAAIGAGANGYLVKSDAGSQLLPAISAVMKGQGFVSPGLGSGVSIDLATAKTVGAARSSEVTVLSAQNGAGVGSRHEVTFYPNDASFVNGFARFAESALKQGNPVVVVATESHRFGILEQLRSNGVDVDAAVKKGKFIEVDALETLSGFMLDGMPDRVRVTNAATSLVARASKVIHGERSRIAICGELAPTLLGQGKVEAALLVESHFDEVVKGHGVDVLCGYLLSGFPRREMEQIFERICAQHSAVQIA